ncbi:copper-translocating P-type ATPase [Otariodibacter sp.]|uniref:heavy metal translocating P-type ATPase n=1 Tax=Otariodibacter sp. TaxID=3030919 RepID=UPI002607B106|nr:copper-translocating P-type ATPase [Otariodibacter sp.]
MAEEKQFLLDGLHCASCVRRVEKKVSSLPEVEFVSVNLADQTAFVQGNVNADDVVQAITKIGFGAEVLESEQVRREKQQAQTQKTLARKKQEFSIALIVGFVLMFYGMFAGMGLTADNQWIWFCWALVSLLTMLFSGHHFFTGAWTTLKNRSANMDTLVAMSTGTAWLYSFYLTVFSQWGAHLYYEASVMIIGFLSLGKYLELKAKQRSSLALEKLLDLAPQQAVIFEDNQPKTISAKGIKPDMSIQALTGDRLVVDGVLESGTIWIDESMLTGEALPIEKKVGDKVRAGTLVQDGAGIYRAEQVGSQTALARIIHAVRHAQSSKPPLAQMVDKIAAVFVPVVIGIALVCSLIWLAVGKDFSFAFSIFTTILIIACPCALGLAIPLSTIAGVARSAEFGVLVRNIDAMQASSQLDTLVFDKTGTLTTGKMTVTQLEIVGDIEQHKVLQLAKSLEKQASHPIAKAIVDFAQNVPECEVSDLQIVKGQGISAKYGDDEIKIGNAKFANFDQDLTASDIVSTLVFVAINQKTVGIFHVQDEIREETKQAIVELKSKGYHCIMLTGDRQKTAEYYAKQIGIDQVIAEVLPEQKSAKIQQLQQQGRKVAMIGDGINDSPALAQADVGIAMHNGSDIAIETADLSLMRSGLTPILQILPFSGEVLRNMKQSLVGALIYNIIAIPVAAGVLYPFTGWLLNPMISAIAMALSSITVVLNSQRLLKK